MSVIVGIDEVGRGSWAGPLVACAVILKRPISGLKDSKKLSKTQREALAEAIHASALAVSLGWASHSQIDELGLTKATGLAMEFAIKKIEIFYSEIIIDGNFNFLNSYSNSKAIVDADEVEPSVSAASIVAKVARDNYMKEIAFKYPNYGFEKHVGYGTSFHRQAIDKYGICDIHRLSFKPVAQTHLV